MFFVPDSTQKLVISGIFDVASVFSVILCPVILYLLCLDRKRTAKLHTIFQMGIVCTAFLCDLFLGISNPVVLLPYPALYCISPIFKEFTVPPWIVKNIFFAYALGEFIIIYCLVLAFHHRFFLLKNDGQKIQNSPIFIVWSIFISTLMIVFIFILQGAPFVDAEATDREGIDEYGSGLYRHAIIFVYFVWGTLFPTDSDVLDHSNARIPNEILTFIKETPGTFYWVLNRSFIRYSAIVLLILLFLVAVEVIFTVLRIFYFTYKLGENIRSKQARQTQIGYVRVLLLQFTAVSIFIALSSFVFFMNLIQDTVNLSSVSSVFLAYLSWHSTANCLILIFCTKSMRELFFKKIKELWSSYHKYHGEHSNGSNPIAGKAHQGRKLKVIAATTRVKPLANNVHT